MLTWDTSVENGNRKQWRSQLTDNHSKTCHECQLKAVPPTISKHDMYYYHENLLNDKKIFISRRYVFLAEDKVVVG